MRNMMLMNNRGAFSKPSGRQSPCGGFTLIEVLVGLVILAIGLLALAMLQLHALRSSNSAHLHSQATMIAYDIIDKMQANRTRARAGNYNIAIGAAPPTTPRIVRDDLVAWRNSLRALPAGDGSVAVATTGRRRIATVIVQWNDRGETRQFQVQTEL